MIVVVQSKLPPYRIPFFLKLSEHIEIKVLFGEFENMDSSHVLERKELFIQVNKIKLVGIFNYLSIAKYITKFNPEAIIFEFSNFNFNLFKHLLLDKKHKTIVWGHGYNRKDKLANKIISKRLKRLVVKKCDAVITYSQGGKNFLVSIGCDPKKIFIAWNAIFYRKFEINQSLVKLKFASKRLVFIGRLIQEKKPELACDLIEVLNGQGKEVYSLDIIGDGSMINELKEKYDSPNIVFHGAITNEVKIRGLMLNAMALINPGYLGLNIVHGLINGLPILSVYDSVDNVYHSPEFEYIKDQICFEGVDSNLIENYLNSLKKLNVDYETYLKKVLNTQVVLDKISLDTMVSGYQDAIKSIN